MNLDDVRTIVQAVGDRQPSRPLLLPGAVGQVSGTGLLEVVMDSDGSSIEASSLFADVAEGDRVMVLFDPPRGVYVVGLIGRTVEAGQMVAYYRDVLTEEAYGAGQTTVVTYSTPTLQWRAGRWYDVRFSCGIDLDANDGDPVTVTSILTVDFAPVLNRGSGVLTGQWGTVDGANGGGAVGTLDFSRLLLMSEPFSQVLDVEVIMETTGVGGDVNLEWEVAVFDAGPASAVAT